MEFAFWAILGVTTQLMLKLYWMKDPPRMAGYTWAIAAAGGLLGGWLFQGIWPVEGTATGVEVAASGLGAFIGAVAALSVALTVANPPVKQ